MLYFVIYAPISLITLVLTCLGFLISDLHISSQVIGEKNEVEAKWIKEGCKTSPTGPRQMIQGKNPRTKAKHQNTHSENGGTIEPKTTMGSPWWWTHGHTSLLLPRDSVFFAVVRFPSGFMS